MIGKPPFQTKEVKTIYKRIRDNEYDFPVEKQITEDARQLIQQILTTNPQERPTLYDILDHPFFLRGIIPPYIPVNALNSKPHFSRITPEQSLANLALLRKRSLLDTDQAVDLNTSPSSLRAPPRAGPAASLAQQEREFQKAVQPGSPISALLSSARQPLVVSNTPSPREKPAMMRKLNNNPPPLSGKGKQALVSPLKAPLTDIREEEDGEEAVKSNRELESQKARIVAQMVPTSSPELPEEVEQENIPPVTKTRSRRVVHTQPATTPPAIEVRPDDLEVVVNTLTIALDTQKKGRLIRVPGIYIYLVF